MIPDPGAEATRSVKSKAFRAILRGRAWKWLFLFVAYLGPHYVTTTYQRARDFFWKIDEQYALRVYRGEIALFIVDNLDLFVRSGAPREPYQAPFEDKRANARRVIGLSMFTVPRLCWFAALALFTVKLWRMMDLACAGRLGHLLGSRYGVCKHCRQEVGKLDPKMLADAAGLTVAVVAFERVGAGDYRRLVENKLQVAAGLYEFMMAQFHEARAFVLELMIVIILVIDLVFLFRGK